MPKLRESKRFDGVGMEAPMSQVLEYLLTAKAVELFAEEKIVKLDIPFSELYHRCSENEWSDLLRTLERSPDIERVYGPSILDRAAASIVAVISVGITILALPIALAAKAFIRFNAAHLYSAPLFVWAAVVCLVAALIGFRLGTHRLIELLGHFWGTGWPENRSLTGQLWIGTFLLGAVTFIVLLW